MARPFFLILSLLWLSAHAQTGSEKGKFYGGIGWHRIFFTRSTIHFRDVQTGNYNFTLYRVKARDDHDLRIGKGQEAPQFTVMAGYNFTKNNGIELQYDHAKYMVVQDQAVRIKGEINGVFLDKDTVLSRDFIQYEHTHGANHFMINFVNNRLIHNNSFFVKPGAGLVVPHSDNRMLGRSGAGKYHVAGFILAIDLGWRYPLLKHAFVQLSLKTAYALYKDVLLYGDGRATQHWFSLQPILIVGYQ